MSPGHPSAGTGVATVRYLLSPIPDALGHWHTDTRSVEPGRVVRHYLPKHQACLVSINGGMVAPADFDSRVLQAGEELLLKSAICIPAALVPALLYIGASIVASIATAFILRALFPPQRPKFAEQDDPTYGFEGIRGTVGPGAKVPIIYGRHRIGGQIINAFVESGHYPLSSDGVAIRYPISESQTNLFMLLALGEGEMAEIEVFTIELNGQPLSNFPNTSTTIRLGTPDQTTIGRYDEAKNSFADGREITAAGIIYTTTTAVHGFQFTLAFEEGLARFTSQGEKINNKVTIQFRYRVNGTTNWSASNLVTVEHAKTSVVRAGVRRDPLPHNVYDIEFSFHSAASVAENARWRPFLESVLEIVYGLGPYPNTALLSLQALATENLSGAIPNVTVIVKGIKVRVGSFAAVPTWSQNPSWCLMDYLTNGRYGLGIPDGEINLTAFQLFANYCDALVDGQPRHTLNMVIVDDAETTILQLLTGCRGILYKIQGQWTPVALQDEPPVQLLSWSNCTNVQLSYTRDPDHINVMEGRFADELAEWEQSVITWPIEDNWPVQVNKSTIDLRGVTNRAAVMRHLQYELNRRRLPKLTLTMDCTLDALALTMNDIFRFSHPLPGWGTAGRLQEGSGTTTIVLDEAVTCEAGKAYHVYIRHDTDLVETRAVVNPGNNTVRQLTLTTPLSLAPTPLTTLYAFGESSPLDTAIREFRVAKLERLGDNTIRINAVQHNASIYDDAIAVPLPVTDQLFNPLGPPPPLTHLVLTELPRVGPDGRQRIVANLSWDVAALSAGYAPYGGALIFRREVTINSTAGLGEIGTTLLGESQSATDTSTDFLRIATVGALILDYDDPLVVTGLTYEYRVVPISQRGVPNNEGSLTGLLHITGPSTPDFFPGTVQNLRLVGQTPEDTLFEGPDVHLEWDPLTSPLFTETFFLKDYVVEVWAPGQAYRLRLTTTTAERFTYTLQHNAEDHFAAGFPAAQRDLLFLVRARTNTGRESLTSATLTVSNPPPDMSNLVPIATPILNGAIIDWTFYVETRDFAHYVVKLDTISPPNATLTSVSTGLQKIFPQGLEPGTRYYVQIIPFDTFGPGIPSGIATVIPLSVTIFDLDTTPPPPPTNLLLTTGTVASDDGTINTYIAATWTAPFALDLAGYQVNFRNEQSPSSTILTVDSTETSARIEGVPGGSTYFVKVAAFDHFRNFSPFTTEQSIVTGIDTIPPGSPSSLIVRGFFRAHVLSWAPPSDADLLTIEIWASTENDRTTAFLVTEVPGTTAFFQHGPLDSGNIPSLMGEAFLGAVTASMNQIYTLWYWIRAKDRSFNVSEWHPIGEDEGVQGTAILLGGDSIVQTDLIISQAAQIANALIQDAHIQNLSASKLLAGTIEVLIRLGVGNIELDAPHDVIRVKTPQGITTIEMGLLDQDHPNSRNYGIRIMDPAGVVLFDATQFGVTAAGIRAGVINAGHIQAGVIDATHLRTDIAVITTSAQIANAIIQDAHIANLSADKLIAGTIDVLIRLGVDNISLDGPANLIRVQTPSGITTIELGLLDPNPNSENYGIRIYDPFGNLLFDASLGGVTAAGIQAGVITASHINTTTALITSTAQIATAVIENAHIQNLTVGTEKIQHNAVNVSAALVASSDTSNSRAEQEALSIVVTAIPANASVVLSYTGLVTHGPNFTNQYILRIRENSLTGPILAQLGTYESAGAPTLFVCIQGVWHNPTGLPMDAKVFVVTIESPSLSPIIDTYTAQGQLVMQLHKK